MVWDLNCGMYFAAGSSRCCLKRVPPNPRWKALGSMPGVCRFSLNSDILTVKRHFRNVYGSPPPPVSNIHRHPVCCHLHCTYWNESTGDLLVKRHNNHYAVEQWVWGSSEVEEESLWLRDHQLRYLKWMRKSSFISWPFAWHHSPILPHNLAS